MPSAPRYRQEIVIALAVAFFGSALLAGRLWTWFPFNCDWSECGISYQYLNAQRLELFAKFGPIAAIGLAIGAVFLVRLDHGRTAPFSASGSVAFAWPIASFLAFLFNPFLGLISAPLALIFAAVPLAEKAMKAINRRSGLTWLDWADSWSVLWTMGWCLYWYFFLIQVWAVLGD